MISFFTSLKAMSGSTAIQQGNALRSWRMAVPDCDILVYGKTEGVNDLVSEVNGLYFPDIDCNEYGTPLISAMFSEAQRQARHPVVCYINGDIILSPDFKNAMKRLAAWKEFCAVGQRWDLDWKQAIDFADSTWNNALLSAVAARGSRHGPLGMDVFAFRRGAIKPLPTFSIGRPAWDNYLIKDLLKRDIPIVDITRVANIVHQNHGYGHVAKRAGDAWEGPEAERNRALASQTLGQFNPRYYSIKNAQWLMVGRWILPAMTPSRVWWRALAKWVPDFARDRVSNVLYAVRHLPRLLPKLIRYVDLFVATFPYGLMPRNSGVIAIVRSENSNGRMPWRDEALAIRARFPRSEFYILQVVSPELKTTNEAASLFDECMVVDKQLLLDDAEFRRKTCRQLARRKFGTVINLADTRDRWYGNFLVKAIGARTSIVGISALKDR